MENQLLQGQAGFTFDLGFGPNPALAMGPAEEPMRDAQEQAPAVAVAEAVEPDAFMHDLAETHAHAQVLLMDYAPPVQPFGVVPTMEPDVHPDVDVPREQATLPGPLGNDGAALGVHVAQGRHSGGAGCSGGGREKGGPHAPRRARVALDAHRSIQSHLIHDQLTNPENVLLDEESVFASFLSSLPPKLPRFSCYILGFLFELYIR